MRICNSYIMSSGTQSSYVGCCCTIIPCVGEWLGTASNNDTADGTIATMPATWFCNVRCEANNKRIRLGNSFRAVTKATMCIGNRQIICTRCETADICSSCAIAPGIGISTCSAGGG